MKKSIEKQLGERIRELRIAKTGLSQEKFANKIGMDRTYFSSVELGRHSVTISIIFRIAQGLDVSLEELFQGM